MKRITILSAMLLANNVFAAGGELEMFEGKVGGILAAKRQSYGTPGMVVTIIRNGVIAGTFVSGYADRENQKPIEPDTLIPAASLTKLLTAVLVVRQAEQGRLQINHPANEYLPPRMQIMGSDGKTSTATLAQLLSHHSGLPVSWRPIASEGDALQSLENYLSQNLNARRPDYLCQRCLFTRGVYRCKG
jgi:CubicO group peptidase (beta-lactamase class C family)